MSHSHDNAAKVSASAPRVIEAPGALQALVKQEVAVTGYIEVSQAMISDFSNITRDHQWIHIDPERARKESPYGTTVAHGFLTLSLVSQFMANAVRVEGVKMAINYGLNRVRFPSAVPAGSQVRARIALSAVEEGPGWFQCTWLMTIERQGGSQPACVAEWLVRYYTK
jgi:acyl dehydratase